MGHDIHRKTLKRLFVAWVTLSVLIGGTVYYLETEKIDDQVLDLALGESQTLTADNLRLFNRPPEERAALQGKVAEFLKSHFIVVELYDRDQQKIAEGTDPGEEAVEQKLKRQAHGFPFGENVSYRKIPLGDELFLQVLVPLHEADGALAGYFEGIYRVDAATLSGIRHDVLRTLVLVVIAILVTTVILYPVILWLNRELLRFSGELLKTNFELMEVLGSAVAKRDSDTNTHNYRVTLYAIRLAEELGLPREEIRRLTTGAFLHDVGKIGISDAILLKPGRLTEDEFAVMRTHVALGVDIIAKSELLKVARDVVEFHHEKFDGKGYLKGLKGEDIPVNARIFAIVDVFDALTSKRPYKDPMPFDEAMAIIRRDSGSHFDPRVVEAFDAIAPTLYQQVNGASEEEIETMLNDLAKKYFFEDTFLLEYLARYEHHAPAAG